MVNLTSSMSLEISSQHFDTVG